MKKVGIFLLFFSVIWNCSAAETPKSNGQSSVFPIPPSVRLAPRAPEIYVITAKDNLNDILSRFVLDNEKLLTLWGGNIPQYSVGDAVSLLHDNQQQALQFKHGRTVKLSPNMRTLPAERANNLLPLEKIQQFLIRPGVVTEEELRKSAYLIGSADKNLLLTSGMQVYARGLEDSDEHNYVIIRPGQIYRDPVSNEALAREAIYLGDAELKVEGDPATLLISNAKQEIRVGDRLIPLGERTFNQDIQLHSPRSLEGARIIAVIGGLTQIGQYQVVVINKGLDENMEVGHILAVKRHGGTVKDREQGNEVVTLPNVNAGTLLIFKVFDKISYAVILKANRAINVLDEVTLP
ncbi:MAG: hypothetical protein PHP00_10470 [Thiotrichaceae bacterium]|nr:hypothetical protein [Thiotrichaceae bacterium]